MSHCFTSACHLFPVSTSNLETLCTFVSGGHSPIATKINTNPDINWDFQRPFLVGFVRISCLTTIRRWACYDFLAGLDRNHAQLYKTLGLFQHCYPVTREEPRPNTPPPQPIHRLYGADGEAEKWFPNCCPRTMSRSRELLLLCCPPSKGGGCLLLQLCAFWFNTSYFGSMYF